MTEIIPPSPIESSTRPRLNFAVVAFDIVLIALIALGVFYRFNWVNWNQDTDLHPDEYGLTGTLTQLSMPKSLDEYFNTRLSPINPYQKYDENGQPTQNGPDNRMRWGQWPIIIIRGTAELANAIEDRLKPPEDNPQRWNFTGYGEMRLWGRSLSALFDVFSLIMIFLIGSRLYNRQVGLLAAALSALAVMQIQQSHFMTVDNFAAFFTIVAMYGCVGIAQNPIVVRGPASADGQVGSYQAAWKSIGWYLLFGVGFGMALASKINLAVLAPMIFVAILISILQTKLKYTTDFKRVLGFAALFLVIGVLTTAVTFRLTQPMTFQASRLQTDPGGFPTMERMRFIAVPGDTTIFTLSFTPDWFESIKVAAGESSGEGGGPPGEQWAHRTRLLFPFVNMVMWGMGLALGLACWIGVIAAFWQTFEVSYLLSFLLRLSGLPLRVGLNKWQVHMLPLIWVIWYFGFMGTRWVMSTRYFLPIYPFMCLLAAWMLLELWRWAQESGVAWRRIVAGAAMIVTLFGAAAWATSFVQAVYVTPHTRIQAAHWIFQNIAGPIHLTFTQEDGSTYNQPIPLSDAFAIRSNFAFAQPFTTNASGKLTQVTLPHVQANEKADLHVVVSNDPEGKNVLAETTIPIPQTRSEVKGEFTGGSPLLKGNVYYIVATTESAATITVYENTLANESWDEGLPMRFEGYDPFGGIYRGLSMEVRWYDDNNKKQMFLDVIGQTDYIIMPSQRGVWSACRIPRTYPMTMDYYRALKNGSLGFDQVAMFTAPMKLGPLQVSDVGGTFAWNKTPELPLFNHNLLAAEEAFSVYDHPPVWIFKKRADFDIEKVRAILDKADLTKVVIQGPTTADGDWCPAQ